jgi:hypothetical protein
MRQHQDPDPYDEDEEDLEELGTPVYQGTGLSVRALTAEELQRFLDAHPGQPAQLLGSGWAALDPPGDPLGGPRTPPAATPPVVPAEPLAGSLGSPGRSALAAPPWPPTAAGAPPSGPPGPAPWRGGRHWSPPLAPPLRC